MAKTKKRTQTGRLGLKEFLLSLFLMVLVWAGKELLSSGPQDVVLDPQGQIQVLFTRPGAPNPGTPLDELLASAIDDAQQSVDVAAFDFDLADVADALVRADKRGVRVRFVTDTDYMDELGPQRLRQAHIPVVTDDREPFMHDKFVVIDGREVWTGSWNLTDNGTYRNDNNAVVLDSKNLADNYTTEFEEMFTDRAFGASSPDNTPHPKVDINGVLLENLFESEGDARSRIVALLEDAKASIYFMAFALTDDDIARVIRDQQRAGLAVQGVVESRNVTGSGSDVEALQKSGVDVLPDGNPYVMHHKVIIIDEAIVITGSYNFSASAADSNDENVLIIHSPEIAARYMTEFRRVYEQAKEAQ